MFDDEHSSQVNSVGQRAAICWECDTPTEIPLQVKLPLPSSHPPTVKLCADCYVTRYLPLLRSHIGI